jgi:hypothetical protein
MHKFVIPALDLIYARVQRGFSRQQKLWGALLGLIILASFMFRAACPPERRFFNSPRSSTMYVCATPDVVNNPGPLGSLRSAQSPETKPFLAPL